MVLDPKVEKPAIIDSQNYSKIVRFILIYSGLGKKFDHKNRFSSQFVRHKDLIDMIIDSNIQKNIKILDVGCGLGYLSNSLFKHGFTDITGCDFIPKNKITDFPELEKYSEIDLNKDRLDSFSDKSFDLIISSDVLEHLENPSSIISGMSRILKDDGDIFITVPNAFNLFERIFILLKGNSSRYRYQKPEEFGHITMFSPNIFLSLFERFNLKIVKKGKGFACLAGCIILPSKKFSSLWSYCLYYHLKK